MSVSTNFKALLISSIIFLAGPAAFAQLSTVDFNVIPEYSEKSIERYEDALKSDNPGVVESAIFYSVKLKLVTPEADTDKLMKAINDLVLKGETETIRYKAHIAAQYYNDPAMLGEIEVKNYKDDTDELFQVLATELQNHLLVKR